MEVLYPLPRWVNFLSIVTKRDRRVNVPIVDTSLRNKWYSCWPRDTFTLSSINLLMSLSDFIEISPQICISLVYMLNDAFLYTYFLRRQCLKYVCRCLNILHHVRKSLKSLGGWWWQHMAGCNSQIVLNVNLELYN